MYIIRPEIKRDPVRRWALPHRVFFAAGACHILAYGFLQRFPDAGYGALWIRPGAGFTGNHIIVARDGCAFDYHGHSRLARLLAHVQARAVRRWPGWTCDTVPLPAETLVSEEKSRRHDGLRLRGPQQFLHDALPRAHRFLDRFPPPRRCPA